MAGRDEGRAYKKRVIKGPEIIQKSICFMLLLLNQRLYDPLKSKCVAMWHTG